MSVFNKKDSVIKLELIDETFREAIERSIVPIKTSEKLSLLIKMVDSGIKKFFVGIGPSDTSLLKECLQLQSKGLLSNEVEFIYIVLLNTWETTKKEFTANFTYEEIKKINFSFGMIDFQLNENLFKTVHHEFCKIGMNSEKTRVSILNYFSNTNCITEEKYQQITKQVNLCADLNVTYIRINDSTGGLNPDDTVLLFKKLHSDYPQQVFSLHTHNDSGFSLINTLKSIEAGCRTVEGSLAGYGNRSGITDIFLLSKLCIELGYNIGAIDLDLLNKLTIEAETVFLLVPSAYRSGSGLFEKDVTNGVLNIPDYLGTPTQGRKYTICADSLHPKTIASALQCLELPENEISSLVSDQNLINGIIESLKVEFEIRYEKHHKEYEHWYKEMKSIFSRNCVTPEDLLPIVESLCKKRISNLQLAV